MKTPEQYFADWESHVFGYGYGTGEEPVLRALKAFLALCVRGDLHHSYEHEELSAALTPAVAWLLINVLCHADIIEYGTSPRYGWLTRHGEALRDFVVSRSVDDLESFRSEYPCAPSYCNCAPEEDCRPGNPFFHQRR